MRTAFTAVALFATLSITSSALAQTPGGPAPAGDGEFADTAFDRLSTGRKVGLVAGAT